MAGITKQTRSYMNQPIGVTTFDTDENEIWKSVANTASQLNQIALKEGVKQAEQSGFDAAMAIDQAQIIAFDAETGKPKALNPKIMSGGIIARDAYRKTVDARFRDSIEDELLNKAKELQIKYEYEPKKYTEELSRYVGEMHKNAQGKWKETIKVGGIALVRSGNLIISEKLKDKTDKNNAAHFENKLQKFLKNGIANNYSAYGEEGSIKSFTELEELITELENLEKINPYINAASISNFEKESVEGISRLEAEKILFSPQSKIQFNNAGNEGRNRIIAALENRENIRHLRGSEKQTFEELTKFTKDFPEVNENLAESLKPIVEEFNENFTTRAIENGVRTLSNIEEDLTNQTNTLTKDYYKSNYINNFLPDGEFETILKQNKNSIRNYITTYAKGDDNEIAAVRALETQAKEQVSRIIIEKLIIGKNETEILKLENVLKSDGMELKNATDEQSILLQFWKNNNLKTKGLDDIFTRARQIYAGNDGKQRIKQQELSINLQDDFELYINSGNNSLEEITKEKNRLINLLNNEGSLNKLLTGSSERFKNNINVLFLDESINQINFRDSQLANATQLFLSSKEEDPNNKLLDDFPEIKNSINSLLKQGFSKSEIKTSISKEESNLRTAESANSGNITHTRLVNEARNGNGNTQAHQKALDKEFAIKYGKDKTFVDNLTGERGAEFINDLNAYALKGTLPLAYETALTNAAENLGLYDGPTANAILEIFRVHSHGTNLETGFEKDLLISRLDTETYATLDFASDLVQTGDSGKALEYIATARAFRDDTSYNVVLKRLFGTEKDQDDKVINQSYIKFLDEINPEISQNRKASDIFYEYTLHAARNNIPVKKIQEKIGDLYDRMFKETDGLVTDFLTADNERSEFALKKVFPNTDLYNAFMSHVQSKLTPMGIGFSTYYPDRMYSDQSYRKFQYDMNPPNLNFDPFNPDGTATSESFDQPAETLPNGVKIPNFKRQAVLMAVPGTSFQTIYMAYERTPSGLVAIKTQDEEGNSLPLAFSSNEQYLLDIEAKADAKRKEINRKDLRKSEILRKRLADENTFRKEDKAKTGSLLQGRYLDVEGYK